MIQLTTGPALPKDETAQNARKQNFVECAMLDVAKNENDSCGIQKLIVKKTNLLMACACALSNPALPPLLSSVKHFPGDAAPVHQLGSMRPFVAHNSKIPSLA